MLKVKNVIKNTPSKLHHIHQRERRIKIPVKNLKQRFLQKQQSAFSR